MRKLMIEMKYRNYTSSKVMNTTWKPETVAKHLVDENSEYVRAIFIISDIETGEVLARAVVPKPFEVVVTMPGGREYIKTFRKYQDAYDYAGNMFAAGLNVSSPDDIILSAM